MGSRRQAPERHPTARSYTRRALEGREIAIRVHAAASDSAVACAELRARLSSASAAAASSSARVVCVRLEGSLGKGSFGEIYRGKVLDAGGLPLLAPNAAVAVKVEYNSKSSLADEFLAYNVRSPRLLSSLLFASLFYSVRCDSPSSRPAAAANAATRALCFYSCFCLSLCACFLQAVHRALASIERGGAAGGEQQQQQQQKQELKQTQGFPLCHLVGKFSYERDELKALVIDLLGPVRSTLPRRQCFCSFVNSVLS